MTENNYEDILDQNVEEVKKAVRELEDPDYAELFELEEKGKDRKTIKEFLELKVGAEDVEEHESEEEEIVEEIEEETENGLLGGFSRESVLASGAILGLIIGLTAGLSFAGGSGDQVSTAQATSGLNSLLEASSAIDGYEIVSAEPRNGLVYTTVNVTRTVQNQTQESQNTFYVTEDGALVFPEVRSPMIQTPINVQESLQRLNQQSANSTQ